jgi:ubiquinone/menaquinone biosynthesis C-methylase UbiE
MTSRNTHQHGQQQPSRQPRKRLQSNPLGKIRAPKETSWGGVSSWYEDVVGDPSSYQQAVILPNVMRILSDVAQPGKTIVDVGCGTGLFSQEIAKSGARVIGVDPGETFISKAKETGKGEFIVGTADKLPVPDDIADAAICILALQNIREAREAVMEWKRIVKTNGKVVIVLNHPAFRIPKQTGWGWDEEARKQYRRIDSYMSESEAGIVMNPGGKQDTLTASFHRPLQWYVKQLSGAGFALTRLEEWISHKKSGAGPRQAEEDRMRKEIPLFLCLEAKKIA